MIFWLIFLFSLYLEELINKTMNNSFVCSICLCVNILMKSQFVDLFD